MSELLLTLSLEAAKYFSDIIFEKRELSKRNTDHQHTNWPQNRHQNEIDRDSDRSLFNIK